MQQNEPFLHKRSRKGTNTPLDTPVSQKRATARRVSIIKEMKVSNVKFDHPFFL